jgi:deoxyribonuclease-4
MVRAVERAVEIGANTIQVFGDNPTAWRRRQHPPDELPAFRDRLAEAGIEPLTVHASYLINLAGPADRFHERSVELLVHELGTARAYGASFVNVHIGSHRGAGVDAGMERLGEGITRVLEAAPDPVDDGPLLVLENSAGGGDGMGITVDELARILESAVRHGAPAGRIGFCFDTAHLWAAGHDLRDRRAVQRLVRDFDARIGLDRLVLVHVNDSKADAGSRLDRHEHLGAGRIGARGLGNLLRHPDLRPAAFYLETPGMDEGYDELNMEALRAILEDRAVPVFPPEALTAQGSRSRRSMPDEVQERDGSA